MSIGARIKGWRTALGISQGELARAANVTISAVSRWECDHNAPSHANLTAIVERFGVRLAIGMTAAVGALVKVTNTDPALVFAR